MGPSGVKALFAGSFDPPTCGHREVLRQACGLFEEVVVGLAVHPGKQALFSVERRLRFLRAMVRAFVNGRVVAYEGLTAAYARRAGVGVLVRGLRSGADLAYERELALGNLTAGEGLPTVFFLAGGPHAHLSARLVREILVAGGVEPALPFLPEEIHEEVRAAWPPAEPGGDA
jgi:pantetheine-phosphate adenylyltransferase